MLYAFIPTICMIMGSIIASLYAPKASTRSAAQHFAAGVVFAAVAVELLPSLRFSPMAIAIGFLIGVFSMLFIKRLTSIKKSGCELLFAVGIDIAIDGLLIGIAFQAGKRGGYLVTTALAIEILFLGIATTAALQKSNWGTWASFAAMVILSFLVPVGFGVGTFGLSQLPPYAFKGVIAFGVAALLYLVTEELLAEAHEVPDKLWVTASFFIGFLIILLLNTS